MVNRLKGIVGQVVRNALSFVENVKKEFHAASQPSGLFTAQSNPELIQDVTDELKRQNASMILGKLQDIEKAIYHLASRQKELTERQELVEQHVVATHTTVEEMLHGMEVVMEESDDSDLDAWGTKKGATTLN
jgi:hypothetical protein